MPAQLSRDREARESPDAVLPTIPFRKRLERDYGLAFGADYNALYQYATESLDQDQAAGGVFRFYGHWNPFHDSESPSGSFVWKIEHRHRLGTSIAPQALASAVGYAGLTAVGFKNAGWLLTNLYWSQEFADNRFAVIGGVVDVTDYVDVYALVNPWTEFNNLAFSTNPTMAFPNQGLGAAARMSFTPNYYVLGGIADANGDPGDPGDMFESFFDVREYYTHIELGWVESFEKRFTDNVHITAWHVDERAAAGVDSGWGVVFSASRKLKERWVPFVRGGYSSGGDAFLDRMISAGVGYQVNEKDDFIGFGASWGRAPDSATTGSSRNQYTFEAYYRYHPSPRIQIVPDVQYLVNPAFAPSISNLWVLGARLRITF